MTDLDGRPVRVLLCDADGNLFPSEGPAFEASTEVTNRLLARLGIPRRLDPDELRRAAVGRNFRAIARDVAREHGLTVAAGELEAWVEEERREVTAHLAKVLRPDPEVRDPLERLAGEFGLAVVSSSALARLDVCFAATGLAGLFPPESRFSAEDSLPDPVGKPDPAVYALAGERLGVSGREGLAVEDAPAGVLSAVAAGFPVVGNVMFVPEVERAERAAALHEAGAAAVVASWRELEGMLAPQRLAL